MRRSIFTPLLTLAALAAAPAARAGWFDFIGDCVAVKSDGPLTAKTFTVADWRKLEVAGALKVTLVAGATAEASHAITLSGPADAIAAYAVEVRGAALEIRPRRGCVRGVKNLEARVPVRELEALEAAGAVAVRGEGILKSGRLQLELSGSGSADLALEAGELQSEISGSGEMTLRGRAGRHHLEIAGSGEIHAAGLAVKNYQVDIAGSGECEITADDSLKAEISGSGEVLYHGAPSRVEKSVSGSGSIRAADPAALREPAPPAAPEPHPRPRAPKPPAPPAPAAAL